MPTIVRPPGAAATSFAALANAVHGVDRAHGRMITDHRTSWVRELRVDGADYFVKIYEYPHWSDRLRSFGRRTGPWARSRAAAEFDALTWMRQHDEAAPEPMFASELRRAGFLVRATLVTAAFDGESAAAWLERLPAAERRALAAAIGRLVGRLHALGFRDRNLDLRNLLARREADGGWTIAKIDSPRHRLRAPGRADDRWTRADWARLAPQLEPYGLADVARGAADALR